MNERLFDTRRGDGIAVHRMPYQQDCGTVHAIGNGETMLYGRGPEWMQLFGAPYSCPTMASLVVPADEEVRCASHRRPGTGSWLHRLEAGTLTDCAPRRRRCVARHWSLDAPLSLLLDAHGFALSGVDAILPEGAQGWLIEAPGNAALYNDYPILKPAYLLVAVRGSCHAKRCETGILLELSGDGDMIAVGGQDYPGCFEAMRAALALPFDAMLAEADAEDAEFLRRCAAHRAPLRTHPLRARAEAAIEDVLFMIRAQQHSGGGIQAGHNYHLAYVRDQYGDFRGLLDMGAWDEAKAILAFYRQVFSRYGCICNAQAMGVEGVFHIHENDTSEITGYLLLQGSECLEVTEDDAFFASLCPMMDWALQTQLGLLKHGMMPFNGDETYIAGGILPRTLLNQGSFEATMLLIEGARRYIGHCRRLGLDKPWMEDASRRVEAAAAAFDANFRRGDAYVTNSPARLNEAGEPAFRHGVCLACGRFGWTHRRAEGWYACAACLGAAPVPAAQAEYSLKSTLLMAPYIGSGLPDAGIVKNQVSEFLARWRSTNRLPSLPEGDLCLGYDYGLLLYAASAFNLEADDLLKKTLELQDEAGAWPEYFEGDIPRQTRCRPWESAINLCGILASLRREA